MTNASAIKTWYSRISKAILDDLTYLGGEDLTASAFRNARFECYNLARMPLLSKTLK